jgi:hypothetical protein
MCGPTTTPRATPNKKCQSVAIACNCSMFQMGFWLKNTKRAFVGTVYTYTKKARAYGLGLITNLTGLDYMLD